MFCRICGREVQDKWVRCPYCGAEILKTQDSKTEVDEEDVKSFELTAWRRTGRFIFQEISSKITITNENVLAVTRNGKKERKAEFKRNDVEHIGFAYSPEWKTMDYVRVVIFALLMPMSYGMSVFALTFFIKIACTQHVVINLKSGEKVKIPICQKADASELLRALGYPEEEILKHKQAQISFGKWSVREWVITLLWMALAAFAITFGMERMLNSWGNPTQETSVELTGEKISDKQEDSDLDLEEIVEPQEEKSTQLSDEQIAEDQKEQEELLKEQYVFPDSDKKYLSEDEVRSVDADSLAIARNEIFARHGYIFQEEPFKQHFASMPWYQGTVSGDQFHPDAVFNDFEKKNIELIKSIENEINGPSEEELAQQEAINGAYNFLVGHSFHLQDSQPLMEFQSYDTVRYSVGGMIEDSYFSYSISARYEVYRDDQKEWLTYLTIDGEEYYLRMFTNGTLDLTSTSGYGRLDGWYELYK